MVLYVGKVIEYYIVVGNILHVRGMNFNIMGVYHVIEIERFKPNSEHDGVENKL